MGIVYNCPPESRVIANGVKSDILYFILLNLCIFNIAFFVSIRDQNKVLYFLRIYNICECDFEFLQEFLVLLMCIQNPCTTLLPRILP